MTGPEPVPPPAPDPAAADSVDPAGASIGDGWRPLPLRARWLFVLGNLFGLGALAIGLLVPIGLLLRDTPFALPLALAVLVALPAWGAWLAVRQYACTRWRLDAHGYTLRRGRLWQRETFVPRSRVQHLDLQRGPLERRFGLATLVVHTAGTRHNAVSTTGLGEDDAEWLRDQLAQWIEADDDDA
ncbi:PH domain-containing protein [Luteimonas sp. M1R5S18]|jgi:membrane protein YdbS with pleckstrin-like domain|uniref:PH domain-containing protein n=1 Tax=Luteimonas rhizosphaericola TaxID=3042024 RepID=A0ABT6JIT3_9GAMM|nr:PH domain-containing protein [Luteimonas rhizosphaericola]MDH5830585.1 PH domain-containing protein [Luteimonas rhizosphaericola]